MNVFINQTPHELPEGPEGATVADAVAAIAARAPFAVAVNTRFVPRADYATQRLQPGDRVEIISPVTGG
ncbi:sulfur carrier protein ThiS [Verminephrobacter aporrectodeae subsp. tuberculatae]|uniref:sulfur carrier protein ThiS n=1 Tax=Verminephrobacter aporrectodeae TaxID=1110389 RepID=UPI0022448181|nr:sulfur carrier protein ThiS [Verminephrobacter aporrectodeae]MCW8205786.1 sulfur carrier protein ThiS [Verminephrobacter aporrectodeae subsp. tuberculatae]